MRKIGKAGLELVKSFESCKLEAYKDGGGVWTIGWGHTGGVKEGQVCTQEQADAWLAEDLDQAESDVELYTRVELGQEQFDALVSFAFNLGGNALRKSTLLRKLNSGDTAGAAKEFPKWKFDNGKEVAGLLRRRLAEQELFLQPEKAKRKEV
jgi:lysozyme